MAHVLFILHFPPPVHGSAVVGKQIRESQYILKGWESTFINLNTSKSTSLIGKMNFGKIFIYATIMWKTLRVLLFDRPDLAYIAMTVKGGGFFKDSGIIFIVKLLRVPIVYHLHNKGVTTCQDRWPYNWLYPIIFRNTKVILLSTHLYPDIARFVCEEAVFYCPNGIPDAACHKGNAPSNEPPLILFLSNLIESKGVFVLLQACRVLKARGIPFRCDFVGGEGDVSVGTFTSKVIEAGLENEVRYLGKCYGVDKEAVFAAADIFAFPTYYHNETFGLVNLEAMQWRLPVVATPEGGIPDVVLDGETGFLVPQRDAVALADRLEKLLKDPSLRQRIGEAGRRRYEAHFTVQHFEERMDEVLKQAINLNGKIKK